MIHNKTRGVKISLTEIKANNYFTQALGLMFSKKQNLIMTFKQPRWVSLHNFFVFYPLEIVLLDENKKVIAIKEEFKPFTFWSYQEKKAKYVLELGLEKSKEICKIGNVLEIK